MITRWASYRLAGHTKHPLVVLTPRMLSDYYGERWRFLCISKKASGNLRIKQLTRTSLQYIHTEMSQFGQGQAATVLVQKCRQIVVDVTLCELLRQLIEKQQ